MRIHPGRLRRLLVCLSIPLGASAAYAGGGSTIGNLVWNDLDNDGLLDAGEPGLDLVTVELWSADDTTLLDTTTTGGGGLYQFADFAPGLYRVRLPAADFDPGGILQTYRSSTGPLPGLPYEPAPDPDTVQVDSDDNGTEAGGPLDPAASSRRRRSRSAATSRSCASTSGSTTRRRSTSRRPRPTARATTCRAPPSPTPSWSPTAARPTPAA